MVQVIIMAREYRRRPSEILGIDNDYLAYCFDEVALYLTAQAMDKQGRLHWNRIRWKSGSKRTNKDLIDFIQKHG